MSLYLRQHGYLNLEIMQLNKIIYLILPLILLSACIKTYTPKIDADSASKIVVSGKLNSKEGYQYIKLSKSLPLNEQNYQPFSNCNISIWDADGTEFKMHEYKEGEYRIYMSQSQLVIGKAYHIRIITPDGDELISKPDNMADVAPIKIPVFELDSIFNGAYYNYTKGLQFYIDIEGNENQSSYYLFELDATYEHRAKYAREYYYDGRVNHIYPPDSSLFYCWTTYRVPEVITLTTENLAENKFNRHKLHFVSYKSEYLTYGYSLLVRQVGLSREAYQYWERMRLNNNQNASLYSKQPVDTQGNITNLTHPEKEVLGFFSASAVSETRIFVKAQPNYPYPFCSPVRLDRLGFREIDRMNYPAFLMTSTTGGYLMIWLPEPCVDCTHYSGTTVKPSFWPN